MEDIRFYDFEFKLLHIANDYTSANWTLRYNDIGTLELHFPIVSKCVPIIMENKYLVAVQKNKAAIITGRMLGNGLAVYGRTCNWLLTRRTTPRFSQREGTVETLTRDIIQTAFADVPELVVEQTANYPNQFKFWRNVLNVTFDVVSECLDNEEAGHEVVFDRKRRLWVYRVLKGEDREIVVSEANRNAYETEYDEDMLDYYTGGWYEEEEDEEADGEPELHYLGDGSEKTGIYKWDAVLGGSNESEAKSSLKTKGYDKKIKLKSDELVWGRDYSLGDTMRLQVQKGRFRQTSRKRIVGVSLWYEDNNIGERPIFEEKETITNVN